MQNDKGRKKKRKRRKPGVASSSTIAVIICSLPGLAVIVAIAIVAAVAVPLAIAVPVSVAIVPVDVVTLAVAVTIVAVPVLSDAFAITVTITVAISVTVTVVTITVSITTIVTTVAAVTHVFPWGWLVRSWRQGIVDANFAVINNHAVACFFGCRGLRHAAHINETVAARTMRIAIGDQAHFLHDAVLRKQVLDVALARILAQTKDAKHIARLWGISIISRRPRRTGSATSLTASIATVSVCLVR